MLVRIEPGPVLNLAEKLAIHGIKQAALLREIT